jgi:hypothetical protein
MTSIPPSIEAYGTYVATQMNGRPIPTDVIVEYRGHYYWILANHIALSLMPKSRFVLSLRYHLRQFQPGVGDHPALDQGEARSTVIRGTYRRLGTQVSLKFHIQNPVPLPRTLRLVHQGEDMTMTYESRRGGRLQRIVLELSRFYGIL